MTAIMVLLAVFPLAGAVAGGVGARARTCGLVAIIGAVASLALAIVVAVRVVLGGASSNWDGFVYLDGLSAFFLVTVAIVVLLASLGSAAYLQAEERAAAFSSLQVRLYFVFFGVFASLMLASLGTGNLGLLFVLIEGSTLASAAIVGIEARASSLEAAWKYVIISSLGVTLALVGTVFLFYSGSALNLASDLRLTWPYLYQHAAALSGQSLKLAFLLAVVGYGTKVGLAPMHTWLPDAHSEAPSPASAMLSAALLNTGMYAIIRFLAIARAGLGAAYVQHVMLAFGFLTVIVGVLFIVRSGNFKRLFAYSSVEHMGIIAVALGFGGTIGLYGALLHTLNHAIGKSVLFLSSGDVVLGLHTRQARQVRGLLVSLPVTGGALLLATMAVLGSPPFGLFLSEITILRAGFGSGTALPILLLVLLVVAFVFFARTVTGMVFGQPVAADRPYPSRASRLIAAAPLVVGLLALLILGLWIPGGLDTLIRHAIGAIA